MYIHTYIHTYIFTYIHTYIHIHLLTCIIYIHTCIYVPCSLPESSIELGMESVGVGDNSTKDMY